MSKMNNRKQIHHFDGYVVHGILVSGFMYQLGEDKFFSSADTLENSDIDPIDSVDHLELEMFIVDECNSEMICVHWKVNGHSRSGLVVKGSNPVAIAKVISKMVGDTATISVGLCNVARVDKKGNVSDLSNMSALYLDVDPKLNEFCDMTRYM